ncbi:4Fe-4S binding protein [Usitatibacter palustris]|uniref:Ferredoxin-type protein NapF n=1 Tax=Usitatibacter palustris TaxID=2732487 RepID=A0A6M4H9N9_9PROT|nr:4Fe-4S binding protein [Usitatibacter palustris]QJR15578.1 Ferredoxin-type protein NapF [Usitatibacter palustris]
MTLLDQDASVEGFSLESRGWTVRAEDCEPKSAALASLVNLAPPDAIASVGYVSHGNVFIVAGSDSARARSCAERLAGDLHVTLLAASPDKGRAATAYAAWTGRVTALRGYLGEFFATISDLKADGLPAKPASDAKFDLILDFSPVPLFAMAQPPQGYFRAPADDASLDTMLEDLRSAVGEFEKPRYFAYRESICAHSRSGIVGCNACIEVCSTQAIAGDGDHVKVDPHLCMGCGACSTVCPSGAMSFQFPRVADRGAQLKQLLSAYRHAGGKDACILFHNGTDGRELLAASAASGRGIPARVLPLEAWHVASIGLDLLLPAIAFGASQVAVLCAGSETREYRDALRAQMAIGETILSALGYSGTHFILVEAADGAAASAAFEAVTPAPSLPVPAAFMLSNDKRTAIEFAVEHLAKHAPSPRDEIALAAGAPYGEVVVDRAKCTMCMACAGACPESALMDGVDVPMLKFLERNCVQCGLCEKTCPEDAITLKPRLLLTPAVRETRVLNETQPFHCVSCNKPFGTKQMVDAMLGRLAGHSMFAGGEALRRLQMCADCRVVDMMSNKNEASVLKL